MALARYLGRNPTVAESLELAKQSGWTLAGGMNGISNENRLLAAMHINAQIETPLNWGHVQLEASRGTPVIVSTPNHYWVIDDYDPVKGEYQALGGIRRLSQPAFWRCYCVEVAIRPADRF